MTPNPSLHELLDSAIAKLATDLMSHTGPEPAIGEKVSRLCVALKRAMPKMREESGDTLTQIIKTIEPNLALPIFVTLSEVAPSIIMNMQQDKMVAERVRHIFRVAEMAQILSDESLRELRDGIRAVQKKIFEAAAR